jgi:hypothetical protein
MRGVSHTCRRRAAVGGGGEGATALDDLGRDARRTSRCGRYRRLLAVEGCGEVLGVGEKRPATSAPASAGQQWVRSIKSASAWGAARRASRLGRQRLLAQFSDPTLRQRRRGTGLEAFDDQPRMSEGAYRFVVEAD